MSDTLIPANERLVTIDDLPDGTVLPHKSTISGRTWGDEDVQCLVLSADGRWYTQRKVYYLGKKKWGCVIVLGFPCFTHPNYYIAAGCGGKRILEASVAQLPDDVLWVVAAVQREAKAS